MPTVVMPSQAREVQLREHGYRDYIQRKGNAHKSISETQKRRNKRIAKQLSLGEHPFARLTQMGGKHLRTIGLARAKTIITLKVITHNLVHLARLKTAPDCARMIREEPSKGGANTVKMVKMR